MKSPRSMPAVLDVAALVVVGVNVPFAVYGYLLFGGNTEGKNCGLSSHAFLSPYP